MFTMENKLYGIDTSQNVQFNFENKTKSQHVTLEGL